MHFRSQDKHEGIYICLFVKVMFPIKPLMLFCSILMLDVFFFQQFMFKIRKLCSYCESHYFILDYMPRH